MPTSGPFRWEGGLRTRDAVDQTRDCRVRTRLLIALPRPKLILSSRAALPPGRGGSNLMARRKRERLL